MAELYDSVCITSVASTVMEIMGLEPNAAFEKANNVICEKFKGIKADRVLLYNPDAVALWIFRKYTDLFAKAYCCSDIAMPMLSVMPSVTPVCFASMYSGVLPQVHGIRKYEKPVLKISTLFDELIAKGKKPAIVSTSGDSISKIFLERDGMDYYIYDTINDVNKKAHELISEDKYDLITVYNGNFDSRMHKTGPESEESKIELKDNISTYCSLVEDIKKYWSKHNTFYGFMPDHGCHEIDGDSGSHGLDMEEDMNIIHFYGMNKANNI